jgi:hypothetical protein
MTVAIQQYANGPVTTVADSGGISSSATTLTLASATGYPSSGNFTIEIDSEIILVTAISGTSLTIARGQEGTTAASHAQGSFIYFPLTAASLQALLVTSHDGTVESGQRQINFVDSGTVTWTVTDDPTNHKVDVSAASSGGGGGGSGTYYETLTAPPSSASFTWTNQGSSTATDDANGLYMLGPAVSGNNGRLLLKSAPSTPYTLTMKALPMVYAGKSHVAGLVVYDSGTGQLVRYGWNDHFILLDKLNSVTSYNSQYNAVTPAFWNLITWLQISDDGTDLIFRYSSDGVDWTQMYSVSRTDFLTTPGNIGLYVESNDSSLAVALKVLSWAFT